MSLPVLICDDSAFARKQLAKALPASWDIELSFAEHGAEALELIQQGKGDLVFLDLNMPVLDGYQTLEAIRQQDLASLVLVVSGDVQEEAKKRVLALGALDFIAKPINPCLVSKILTDYGIFSPEETAPETLPARTFAGKQPELGLQDLAQEVINIAMGQAGKLLGDLLKTFIHLPVPQVHLAAYAQLPNLMTQRQGLTYSAVSQGFTGAGLSGEAIAIISSPDLPVLANLLQINANNQEAKELETLTELTGLLAGACLHGIAKQLDVGFSLGHPTLLGQNSRLENLLGTNKQQVLAVDLDYQLLEYNLQCDLLLVFTQDSLPVLSERMSLLSE